MSIDPKTRYKVFIVHAEPAASSGPATEERG